MISRAAMVSPCKHHVSGHVHGQAAWGASEHKVNVFTYMLTDVISRAAMVLSHHVSGHVHCQAAVKQLREQASTSVLHFK